MQRSRLAPAALWTLTALAAPAPAGDGWRPLFDGAGTAGWHAIGTGSWTVEDGVLVGRHAAGEQPYGHLVSDGVYGDFALRVEFRSLEGNSGLYFRVAEEGFSGVTGFQAEIDPQRKTGGLYETGGRAWVVEPPPELLAEAYRPGDWNVMTVSARGRWVAVELNGVPTAELRDDPGRLRGHLALQLHGGQDVHVEFRRVEILVDESPGRVLLPGRGSRDARLGELVTLDSYHPWEPYDDLESWAARAERVRRQVLVAGGLWPMPPRPPLEPVVHGAIDRGDYTIEKVFFASHPGFYVTGNLYRPKAPAEGPRPAVLSPHGHRRDGRLSERSDDDVREQLEQGWETREEDARYYIQARCAGLARLGCVVFHYDMVGYADSLQLGHGAGFGDVEAELRLQNAFGLQTFNSIRALDFLAGLPDVDPERIGVTGSSGGGTQTFILCAVDPRPAAAFPAVMVSTAMQGGCVCENASHLRVGTGNIELAALTAPRPLAMTGADDWTIDIETRGLPELKVLYGAYGVPELVDARCRPDFDHNYNRTSREQMYAWFNRHLDLGAAEPVEEEPFEPVPPAELRVFGEEHPLPDDATDAAGLRRYLTEAAEAQLAALEPRDAAGLAEFRRVVGGALEVLTHTSLPESSAVESQPVSEALTPDGGSLRKLVLARAGSGEELPAVLQTPGDWNGVVVVAVSAGGRRELLAAGVVDRLLARRAAALLPDVLLTGEGADAGPLPVDRQRHGRFAGYTYGYNATLLAHRVHDVLTAAAHARGLPGVRSVRLLGTDGAGPWVVLAQALAGGGIERTAARWGWDFDQVREISDPNFLPGALRYGGMASFAGLCAPAELRLFGGGAPPERVAACYAAAGAPGGAAVAGAAEAEAWIAAPRFGMLGR